MTPVLVALVLVPAVSGVLLLLAGRRADRAAGPVAVVASVLLLPLSVGAAVARPRVTVPFLGVVDGGDLELHVDGLSAVMVVTVAAVAAAVAVFAVGDLPPGAAVSRFFGYLLLFVTAMLVTVTATTFPTLLLAWELMGATSYALVGYRWQLAGKMSAGTTAFLTTRAGDLGLYVAAGAALAATGSLRLDVLVDGESGWRDLAAAGILLAALGKSAQLPFSGWLSAAMAGPSAVSALLHSATMVAAGGYLLLRIQELLAATGWAASAAAWAGALTALVLGAVACGQRDLKQLLAASTAAQIGFVVLAAGLGATAGGTAQLVAHAGVKAGLFVAAGAWLTSLGTKQLSGLRGAARRHRGVGAASTVALLALAGVPPASLWATKDAVLAGVEGTALRVVVLAAAALSAAYAGRVLVVVLARPDDDALGDDGLDPDSLDPVGLDAEEPGTRRVPAAATAVAAVLAVVAVVLGAIALPAVSRALDRALGVEGQPVPSAVELFTSGALSVVVLALVVWRPGLVGVAARTLLRRWAGLKDVLSPRPVMALARFVAVADARVVDGAVEGLAAAVRHLATTTSRADGRLVDGAVRQVAEGFRSAGDAARRPQTGLLHQYYAQAVVGLGALLVLLLMVR